MSIRAEFTKDLVVSDGAWVDARAYGSDLSNTTISAAISAISSDTKCILLAPGTWTIGANLTTDSNIFFRLMPGAKFSVSNTFTLTINSPQHIEALPQQDIFTGAGDVAFTNDGTVWADWFGSDIQAALDAVTAKSTVRLLPKSYTSSTTITIPSNVHLIGDGRDSSYITISTANTTGITVASTSRNNRIGGFKLIGTRTDTTSKGLDFSPGLSLSKIYDILTDGFFHGFYCEDGGSGGVFWQNIVEHLRCTYSAGNAVYLNGSASGNSVDNLFLSCYADKFGDNGFKATYIKRTSFINCIAESSSCDERYVSIGGSYAIGWIGGAMENGTIADGRALMEFRSGTIAAISNVVFSSNTGPGSGDGGLIAAFETSKIVVSGCYELLSSGATMRSLMSMGDGSIIRHFGNDFDSAIYFYATDDGRNITEMAGKQIVMTQTAIDLSGAATTQNVTFFPGQYGNIIKAYLLYSEATSADAGITLKLGYPSDDDYFGTVTTEVGQSQWDTTEITISKRVGAYAEPIQIYSPGGKTGTGECYLVLEITLSE
jgi:hypothetical protein